MKSLQGYQVDRKAHGDENVSHFIGRLVIVVRQISSERVSFSCFLAIFFDFGLMAVTLKTPNLIFSDGCAIFEDQ